MFVCLFACMNACMFAWQVVAEGVETNNQLSFLSGLRCEQLQGYLYSKPLPEGDFQKYLLSYQITKASTNFGKASR